MPISVTYTKANLGDLNATEDQLWDDATMDRFLAWAKATYPTVNPDGTVEVPTDQQACRRAARAYIRATRDTIRKWEKDAAVAAVTDPPVIDA